jgi:hypothetical protein
MSQLDPGIFPAKNIKFDLRGICEEFLAKFLPSTDSLGCPKYRFGAVFCLFYVQDPGKTILNDRH